MAGRVTTSAPPSTTMLGLPRQPRKHDDGACVGRSEPGEGQIGTGDRKGDTEEVSRRAGQHMRDIAMFTQDRNVFKDERGS